MRYREIKTNKYVWSVIKLAHPELKVFESYSASEGDYFGNPDVCMMLTAYGFDGTDIPIIKALTTWEKGRREETIETDYWLCSICEDDQ